MHVTLRVYNLLGQEVATLVNREQEAEHHHIEWDGTTDAGVPVSSGIYFYRIQAGSYTRSGKMVVVR